VRKPKQEKYAYDARIALWLSRDPIEQIKEKKPELLPEGPNLYAYVANNPVNKYDPDGLAVPAVVGGGIALGAGHAIAATFGLSLFACSLNDECRAALIAAASRATMCGAAAGRCVATKWCNVNPEYGSSKPCSACYGECMRNGFWPLYKCP